MLKKYIVIRDSREKPTKGWTFNESEFCAGTEIAGLKTADYSIKGLESILSIERKGCVAEFAQNLIQERFIKELMRLELIPYSFIILEFEMRDLMGYPFTTNLPPRVRAKVRINGHFLLKKLIELQCKFKTHFIFAGSNGKDVATAIFKQVMKEMNGKI